MSESHTQETEMASVDIYVEPKESGGAVMTIMASVGDSPASVSIELTAEGAKMVGNALLGIEGKGYYRRIAEVAK